MLTPEQKRMGVRFGVLLAPLVLVKVAATMLGAEGPRSADASSPAPAIANDASGGGTIVLPEFNQSPEQQAAAERALRHARARVATSPFLAMQSAGEKPVLVATDDVVDFAVSAIMVTRGGNTALIDGQLRKVGDEIAPGCVITEIDNDKHCVTVLHQRTGEKVTRSVDLAAD